MYDNFRFMYTSDPGVRPHETPLFLLTSLKIRTGDRNWRAALQHYSYHCNIFTLFSRWENVNIFKSLSIIAESDLLYICIPLLSKLKIFPGMSERLFFVSTFSSMLKSVQHCSGSFFELQLQSDFQQSYFVFSVWTLKSFEGPISLASLWQWHEQSVCVGQILLLRVHEYARRFYCFVFIIRNNDSV